MKILQRLFVVAAMFIVATSCGAGSSSGSNAKSGARGAGQAKYIFYFIGDGMAAPQVQLAEAALASQKFRDNFLVQTGLEAPEEALNLKRLGIVGLATSSASNRYITDSAAAGTALATGSKTNVGVISQDVEGNTLQTVAEMAKARGMKVGIVSSVSLDHATPACFYAHTASRGSYAEISEQSLSSGFDYFAGGSFKWDKRAAADSTDKATAYAVFCQKASAAGFKSISTKAEFDSIIGLQEGGVIATLGSLGTAGQDTSDGSAMPYTIDLSKQQSEDDKITLAQFTQKGIEVLDNEDGFFMMVEGGKIDWACHANDAATVAYEVVAFDQAIGVAMEFAAKHPDQTLIVVTGDHDCGGLTLGFAGTGYEMTFDILANSSTSSTVFAQQATKKIASGESFDKLLAFACQEFGFTNNVKGDNNNRVERTLELSDYEVKLLRNAYTKSVNKVLDAADNYHGDFGGYDPFTTTCTNILNNKSGIDFASYSHTALPVMVFADGADSDIFSGYYDNTDIPKKIMEAAGL